MPHISKKLLEKDKFFHIHKQLYKVVNDLVRSGKTKTLFDDLLTKTEKIMLSKRLAVIVMLDNKESIYAIENILKVSSSTVGRMSYAYERGMYRDLLKEIRTQNSFWNQLKKIIPPKVGRDRFKNFNNL